MPRRNRISRSSDPEIRTGILKTATDRLLESVERQSRQDLGETQVDEDSIASFYAFLALFDPSVSRQGESALWSGISTKDQRDLLLSAVEGFTRGHATRFFSGLASLAESTIDNETHVPEYAKRNYGLIDDPATIEPDQKSSHALQFLRFAAICAQRFLEIEASRRQCNARSRHLVILQEVFDVAALLHHILLDLNGCGPDGKSTQQAICRLCESWWNANGQNREHLISQMLPLMVQSALSDTSPKAELSRLYKMREAIQQIDFSDESSNWLRSVLMRVASSPRCLKISEGRRFSAYVFGADRLLVLELHQAMRAQIPDGKEFVLRAYSEIYYRAWTQAATAEGADEDVNEDDSFREQIEAEVLHDLVYTQLNIARPSMFWALMKVFQHFHDTKRKPEIEDLLHRLYGPILWRSLEASNAKVRVNATHVLGEVFPLDQSAHTQTSRNIDKACSALVNSLQDIDSQVRIAASAAVAKVLTNFWDAMPPSHIRHLLNEVVVRHASDAASSRVRAAALASVTKLLRVSPSSHGILRLLLPKVGNLIHDKVERVRLAVVRLLQQVKETRGIKYHDVVSKQNLISRLAAERKQGPVASALTCLLLNAFVPQGDAVQPADQIARTLKLLKKNPKAADNFYSNMARHCPLQVVTKLAAWLFKCLWQAVSEEAESTPHEKYSDGGRRKKRRRPPDGETRLQAEELENQLPNIEQPAKQTLLSVSQTELVALVAETVCSLGSSVQTSLRMSANEECWHCLRAAFAENALTEVIQFADVAASRAGNFTTQDFWNRTRAAMLRCAAWSSAECSEGLENYAFSLFKNARKYPDDPVHKLAVPGYAALFCHWGKQHEVSTALGASISNFADRRNFRSPLQGTCRNALEQGSRSLRAPQLENDNVPSNVPTLPPQLALSAVVSMLHDPSPVFSDARMHILNSPETLSSLRDSLAKGLSFFSRVLVEVESQTIHESSGVVEFALRACELYGKVLLLKQNIKASCDDLRDILVWASSSLVPFLAQSGRHSGQHKSLLDPDVSHISLTTPNSLSDGSDLRSQRRTNRGSSNGMPGFRDDVESASTCRKLSESLFVWTCSVLTDWISLTGSGASGVSAEAVSWSQLVVQRIRTASDLHLVRSFLRLALVLLNSGEDTRLLTSLVVELSDGGEEVEHIFADAFAFARMRIRAANSQLFRHLAHCIFMALQTLTLRLDWHDVACMKLPESANELWHHQGSVSAAVHVLGESHEWRVEMAKVAACATKKQALLPEKDDRLITMHLRLLWCLYMIKPAEIKEIITSDLTPDILESCADRNKLVSDFFEALN